MTRFARAKGSKASNERVAEEATPWGTIKEQMLNKKKQEEENKQLHEAAKRRQSNYDLFLNEKEEEEAKNVKWADFPGATKTIKKENSKIKERKLKTTLKNEQDLDELKVKLDNILEKGNEANDDSDEAPEEISAKNKPQEVVVQKTAKKKLLKIVVDKLEKQRESALNNTDTKTNKNTNQSPEEKDLSEIDLRKIEKKKERRKKQLEKKKMIKQLEKESKNNEAGTPETTEKSDKTKTTKKENKTEEDIKKIEKKKQRKLKQLEKKKNFKDNKNDNQDKPVSKGGDTETAPSFHQKVEKTNTQNVTKPFTKPFENKNKNAKIRDDREHSSKKFKSEKMTINGKEVHIGYVDGFPVKKEDADRLKKLRKEMISKGLPRSEINISLKLERRKAEKALSREKKNVCFNCRKSGHNLSECPELNKDQVAQSAGTGICFKCGSTEHTHFECKVVRGQEFKFAQCFICNEQGHIARQCPDNSRGLYPKGGACKVCGDVTHLKKDCPKYQAQQEQLQNNISLEVFNGENPDDLDTKQNRNVQAVNKRPNKVIKF